MFLLLVFPLEKTDDSILDKPYNIRLEIHLFILLEQIMRSNAFHNI